MKIQDGAQNLPVLARERVIAIPRVSAVLQGGAVAGSADLSAAPDRAAVGSISKQAGLSKFQVSGVGCLRSETIADRRYKPGMN